MVKLSELRLSAEISDCLLDARSGLNAAAERITRDVAMHDRLTGATLFGKDSPPERVAREFAIRDSTNGALGIGGDSARLAARAFADQENLRKALAPDMEIAGAAALATFRQEDAWSMSSALRDATERAAGIRGAFQDLTNPARELWDRVQPGPLLGGSPLNEPSIARRLADDLAVQQEALANIKTSIDVPVYRDYFPEPRIPNIRLPPNPLIETNDRLARMEERHDEHVRISGNSLALMQSYVTATEKNHRANDLFQKITILVAIVAVCVTLGQSLYGEFWRAPSDAASLQALVVDLKGQLSALQEAQRAAADRLAETLIAIEAERSASQENRASAGEEPAMPRSDDGGLE